MRRLNTLERPLWLPFMLPQVPGALRRLRRVAMRHAIQLFDADTPHYILIGRTLVWPLLALLHGGRLVRRHRHIVRVETGWGPLRQLLHLAGHMLTLNLRPQDYYDARFFRAGRRRQAKMILPERETQALLVALTAGLDLPALTDKVRFHRAALAAGLPVPDLVASFVPGIQPLDPILLPPSDLFAKPAGGFGGQGAELWRWLGGAWHHGDEHLEAPALLARFAALGRTAPWLLQRRVRNHAAWTGLTPGALATVRIVTLHHSDGTFTALLAFLRLPRGDAVVDNLSAGGLAAEIDLATGRLGPARQIRLHTPDHLVHPDTGYRFAGTILPHWPALCALAVRAHHAFPEAPTIGWDLTLAEEGPLVIEPNLRWGIPLDTLVGETAFVDFCLSRLAVPEGTPQPAHA